MKRAVIVLASGLLLAGLGYCGLYFAGTAPYREMLASETPELLWLKKEFKLSDANFSRISQLHDGYLPQCKKRCRQIEEQNGKLKKLLAPAARVTPEIQGVLSERARLRAECQAEMLKHFFEVSRTMPPEQGRRYLAWVQEQTCLREQDMEARHQTAEEHAQ
jgi:hypothetical protein